MRVLAVLLMLGMSMEKVAAGVAVLQPGSGTVPAAALAAARGKANQVERFLRFGGMTATMWPESDLAKLTTDDARVLIVASGPLSPPGIAALERFVGAGGKLLLFPPAATSSLPVLVGVGVGEPEPGSFAAMQFSETDAERAPGLPTVVPQAAATRKLTALEGTRLLGEWRRGERRGPAAVALSDRGAYVNGDFGLGEPRAKGWLLQALVASLDPETAQRTLSSFRRLAGEALQESTTHWAQARVRSGLDPETTEAIDRSLTRLRLRMAASPAAADTPAERAAAVRRIQTSIVEALELKLHMVPSPTVELRGVWIHTYAPTDWETVMAKLEQHHFNSIFVRVGRGGNVIYPSALLPRDAWAERAGGDEVQRAIEAAHRHGIAFYAWRVNFHMGSAPAAYYDKMAAEDRLVRGPDGKQAHWANPGDPRNTELELQAMLEMVRNYDVDGIQFDYIRYPDEPHFDFDYGPVSRREFEKATGRTVADWPREVLSGALKVQYETWERGNINGLVERVAREARRMRSGIKISAAVWRNHRYWRPILKQDWPLWVERGWLDFVVPMDYTTEQETLAQTVETQVAESGGRAPIMAGIGNYLLFTPEEVVSQVESARAAGAAGFVLFAYNAEQIDEHLRALAAGATSRPASLSSRAPLARLTVGDTVARRDAPPAVLVGSAQIARLETPADGPWSDTTAELVIESPDGQRLLTLGPVPAVRRPAGRWSFKAPAGRWRPALRGTWSRADRPREAFVVLGPVVDGVEAGELEALRARTRPPAPSGAGRRIAIYAYGIGADRLREALSDAPEAQAFLIYDLTPAHLERADVLVLPQLYDVLDLSEQTIRTLRQWVERGGTLLLTHDAVGARWHPRLFPEAGEGSTPVYASALEVIADVPGLKAGSRVPLAYPDLVPLQLPADTQVLVRAAAPPYPPVVARRTVGRGTVILSGALLGGGGAEMTPEERILLRAIVLGAQPGIGAADQPR